MSERKTMTTTAGAPVSDNQNSITGGAPVSDNQNSITAGAPGPVLMLDYQLIDRVA